MTRHTYTVTSDNLSEVNVHMRGLDYSLCLYELSQIFREKKKHSLPETTWEEVYTLFWEVLQTYRIDPLDND